MQQLVSERAHLEAELRAGVERKEFVMLLQPQVDGRGEIVGSEALIRWHHPVRGIVMPSDFIPVAESSGLIVSIGQFVLETACRQLAAWSRHSVLQNISIAINVSAAQIHDERFVENVLELIDRTGVDPKRVKLELTESILVRSVHEIIEKMRQLQAVGISFSLDDFGTGYSSLSYLKRLPLKQLKIDREFVKDILVDANDAAIARMIVALGRSLELDVIAEGVETTEQRDYLDDLGCRSYQGYLFGRPMPVSEFEEAVRRSGQTADQLQSVLTEADYAPYLFEAEVRLAPGQPLMLSPVYGGSV
jgi:EAL domain-containing protein (putative c-di-GMP-specific phosphodiesterase class I)